MNRIGFTVDQLNLVHWSAVTDVQLFLMGFFAPCKLGNVLLSSSSMVRETVKFSHEAKDAVVFSGDGTKSQLGDLPPQLRSFVQVVLLNVSWQTQAETIFQ
jgi:hypothetical protein